MSPANMGGDVYLTKEGMAQMEQELAFLTGERREEIALKLKAAISQGDLSENADYHAAKEEQAFVEGRIRELEDALRRAKLIEHNGPADMVSVGSTVTVIEEGETGAETYHIVGPHEADPGNGRISHESPIGQALLGARKGDSVTVKTPAGEIRLQVQSIG